MKLKEHFNYFIESIYYPDYRYIDTKKTSLFFLILFFPFWVIYKIINKN